MELLDDARNDIFILPDSKAAPGLTLGLSCRRSGLFIVSPEERIDIRWGAPSQIRAELKLFETVLARGADYDYVHLLSGVDLPLKTQDEIHAFFDAAPPGSNFIEIDSEGENPNLTNKTRYYHLFLEHQRAAGPGIINKGRLLFARAARKGWVGVQKIFGLKRRWSGLKLARGLNWASLSPDFIRYLVENRDYILKRFRGVVCSDEVYKQTMIINSEFDSTVRAYSRGNSDGIRLLDWKRGNVKAGNPYVWRMADRRELEEAFELFARKFSSSEDPEIIDTIRGSLLKETPSE